MSRIRTARQARDIRAGVIAAQEEIKLYQEFMDRDDYIGAFGVFASPRRENLPSSLARRAYIRLSTQLLIESIVKDTQGES